MPRVSGDISRKVGQIIWRSARTWLVRVHNRRDPETKKREYLNQTVYGGLRDAHAHLNKMLGERDRGRVLYSSKETLNEFLEPLARVPWPSLRLVGAEDYPFTRT